MKPFFWSKMKKISLGKGNFCIVDDEDYLELSKFKWYADGNGYAVRGDTSTGRLRIVKMHRQILKLTFYDGILGDHKNLDVTDNRRENLRKCNHAQNMSNSLIKKNNTSGFKGVCQHKKSKKWNARIRINGVRKFLGSFNTAKEAYEEYCKQALLHYGEFARL